MLDMKLHELETQNFATFYLEGCPPTMVNEKFCKLTEQEEKIFNFLMISNGIVCEITAQ